MIEEKRKVNKVALRLLILYVFMDSKYICLSKNSWTGLFHLRANSSNELLEFVRERELYFGGKKKFDFH